MAFSWNSTHTALASIVAISISAMHYGVDIGTISPVLAAIGAYAAIREKKRVKST